MSKLLDWLKEQWGEHRDCPYHAGSTDWMLGETIVQTIPNGAVFGSPYPTYPCAVVTCTRCGNTVFINAILAGLVDQQTAIPGGTSAKDAVPGEG